MAPDALCCHPVTVPFPDEGGCWQVQGSPGLAAWLRSQLCYNSSVHRTRTMALHAKARATGPRPFLPKALPLLDADPHVASGEASLSSRSGTSSGEGLDPRGDTVQACPAHIGSKWARQSPGRRGRT